MTPLERFKGNSAQRISFEERREQIIKEFGTNPHILLTDPVNDLADRLCHSTVLRVACPHCGKEKTMKLPSLLRSKNGTYCISCRYTSGLVDGSEAQRKAQGARAKRNNMSPQEKVRMWRKSFPVKTQLLVAKWQDNCASKLDWSRKVNSYEVSAA